MKTLLAILALAAAAIAYFAWQRRSPRPFPPWLTPILHAPYRRRVFPPDLAAERHGIRAGQSVLEIGPGDGYLTSAARRRAAPGGRLVCLDIQLPMLRKLRAALGANPPPLVCASGSRLPFRSGAFDLVFLVHVLGEIPDRSGALAECARVLRAAGTLAVTEGFPDPDFIRSGRLVGMAAAAGFAPAERFGGRFHYTQRFRKGGGS